MPRRTSVTHRWLLPTLLILFILEIASLPLVINLTYSGRSDNPDRIITYTTGKLAWTDYDGIDVTGAARLSLFSSLYENAQASDGANILAPGTSGDSIICLKNNTDRDITFKAVVYEIKSSESLAIETALNGNDLTDTKEFMLPEGVSRDSVIRAVTGIVEPGRIQDFDIDWQWKYEADAETDLTDSVLGDKSAAGDPDDVTIGFYLVVEDKGEIIGPDLPQTGDNSLLEIYLIIVLASGAALIFLFAKRKKERSGERNGE